MAKNSQSSNKNQEKTKKENRVCEKIFRAVTSPVRTVRRITNKPPPNHHQTEAKFAETTTQTAKPITKNEPKKKSVITRVDTTMKTDDKFNDYIKKAKLKIRAMTNLGDMMENESETETHNHHHNHHHQHHHHVPISRVSRESNSERSDRFSEYIKKAKMKLRSSSTIAHGNHTYDSFKIVKD